MSSLFYEVHELPVSTHIELNDKAAVEYRFREGWVLHKRGQKTYIHPVKPPGSRIKGYSIAIPSDTLVTVLVPSQVIRLKPGGHQ